MHPKLSAAGRSLIRPRRWCCCTDALLYCCTDALREHWCAVILSNCYTVALSTESTRRPKCITLNWVTALLSSSLLVIIFLCGIIVFLSSSPSSHPHPLCHHPLCHDYHLIWGHVCVKTYCKGNLYKVATVNNTKNIGLGYWILTFEWEGSTTAELLDLES